MGVEPTILAAKDRINGFEGHEGHRTPFASELERTGLRSTLLQRTGLAAGTSFVRAGRRPCACPTRDSSSMPQVAAPMIGPNVPRGPTSVVS